MNRLLLALGLIFLAVEAHAGICTKADEPFVCYGQYTAPYPAQWVANPNVNHAGMLGECGSLPYTVPAGKTLVIEAMHLEGAWSGADTVLYTGTGDITTAVPKGGISLVTPNSDASGQQQATNQVTNLNYWFPAGTVINLGFYGHTYQAGIIFGWDFTGCLLDAP